MAGELVWDDDIQRYKGVPEFMPTPSFDVDAWFAGLTEEQKTQMAISYARSTREETRPLEMLPDWRNSHLVLRDDNGEKLNPRDFGLQAADRIKSAYVLAHPEMPWPQWIISQAQKIAPERTEP